MAVSGISKAMVVRGNVDSTTDTNKHASIATQIALYLKAPLSNPTCTGASTGISKAMLSLGDVDSTADASKPVSTAAPTL